MNFCYKCNGNQIQNSEFRIQRVKETRGERGATRICSGLTSFTEWRVMNYELRMKNDEL